MTSYDPTAEVIRDQTYAAAHPNQLEPGGFYTVVTGNGVERIDLTGDQYRDRPKRKAGLVTVRDVASFTEYYGKHNDDDGESEVFADLDAATITAVLDAHHGGSSGQPNWQEHRLHLALQPTLAWKTWRAQDRVMMPQAVFAEFLEDNASDIDTTGPVSAADLLEIAQTFQAITSAEFKGGTRLSSGAFRLSYVETTDARAGAGGAIEIPTEFSLGIAPYEDCDGYRIKARFRYRLQGGQLTLGYFLNEPDRIAQKAVKEITGKLTDACDVQVMYGQPA